MTRKGCPQRDWTTSEVSYLVEMAGRIPKREICKHLRRTSSSVRGKAQDLRSHGEPVDLRCHRTSLEACPACGCMRSTLGKHGICKPCRQRAQLATIHSRIAALLPRLPFEEREKYIDAESIVGSEAIPMPQLRIPDGISHYMRCLIRDRHDRAMEAWQIRNLERQVKAAQKRKERIEEKVNGV